MCMIPVDVCAMLQTCMWLILYKIGGTSSSNGSNIGIIGGITGGIVAVIIMIIIVIIVCVVVCHRKKGITSKQNDQLFTSLYSYYVYRSKQLQLQKRNTQKVSV